MIRIIKPYFKWQIGDKPNVGIGTATEMVEAGFAEWIKKQKKDKKWQRKTARS